MDKYLKALKAALERSGADVRLLDQEYARKTSGIRAQDGEDGNAVEMRISGVLDPWFGVDVRDLIAELDKQQPTAITLLIESPGGLVSDGLAIYSDLMRRAENGVTITAEARGVVASAAVLPYLAASTRIMGDGSQIMVHEPWGGLMWFGTSSEIRAEADRVVNGLDAATATYAEAIVKGTGKTAAAVAKWLKTDTWFTASEAEKAGFGAVGEVSNFGLRSSDKAVKAALQRAAYRARQG